MQLTAHQVKALNEALLDAFQSYKDLQRMVRFQLNERLANIAGESDLKDVVFALVEWAETRDQIEELLAGALAQNGTNKRLRQISFEALHTSATPPKPGGRFEAKIRESIATLPVTEMLARFSDRANAVGRFEIPLGSLPKAGGTAFLIGHDFVITNRHVIDLIDSLGVVASECGVRFGYREVGATGQAFRLAEDWHFCSSPKESLDYAIVRLERPPGIQPIDIHDEPFNPGDIEYILHHPNGDPLMMTPGEILQVDSERVVYAVNTECGSSGAPVFTSSWNAVALHHFGTASGNRGIPLALIKRDLETNGRWEVISRREAKKFAAAATHSHTATASAVVASVLPPTPLPQATRRIHNLKRIHSWLHARQLELLKQLRPLCLRFPRDTSLSELTRHLESMQRQILTFQELKRLPEAEVLYLELAEDLEQIVCSLEAAIDKKSTAALLEALDRLDRVLGQTMPTVDGAIVYALNGVNGSAPDDIKEYVELHHRYQSIDNDMRFISQALPKAPLSTLHLHLDPLIRKLKRACEDTPPDEPVLVLWKGHMLKAIKRLQSALGDENRRQIVDEFVAIAHLADERFNGADQTLLEQTQ
jgi:hypothetical protein